MTYDQTNQISLNDWASNQPEVQQTTASANFRQLCQKALSTLDLPDEFASWQQNKGGMVLKFSSTPVIGLSDSKKGLKIDIRTSRLPAIKAGLPIDPENNSLYPERMEPEQLVKVLRDYFDQVIDQLSGDRFACCSLYRQCSAAGSCIQADKLLAIDCVYRRNLKAGQNYFV